MFVCMQIVNLYSSIREEMSRRTRLLIQTLDVILDLTDDDDRHRRMVLSWKQELNSGVLYPAKESSAKRKPSRVVHTPHQRVRRQRRRETLVAIVDDEPSLESKETLSDRINMFVPEVDTINDRTYKGYRLLFTPNRKQAFFVALYIDHTPDNLGTLTPPEWSSIVRVIRRIESETFSWLTWQPLQEYKNHMVAFLLEHNESEEEDERGWNVAVRISCGGSHIVSFESVLPKKGFGQLGFGLLLNEMHGLSMFHSSFYGRSFPSLSNAGGVPGCIVYQRGARAAGYIPFFQSTRILPEFQEDICATAQPQFGGVPFLFVPKEQLSSLLIPSPEQSLTEPVETLYTSFVDTSVKPSRSTQIVQFYPDYVYSTASGVIKPWVASFTPQELTLSVQRALCRQGFHGHSLGMQRNTDTEFQFVIQVDDVLGIVKGTQWLDKNIAWLDVVNVVDKRVWWIFLRHHLLMYPEIQIFVTLATNPQTHEKTSIRRQEIASVVDRKPTQVFILYDASYSSALTKWNVIQPSLIL